MTKKGHVKQRRRFNGDLYVERVQHPTKTEAKHSAAWYRVNGYKARIIKGFSLSGLLTYRVYVRKK